MKMSIRHKWQNMCALTECEVCICPPVVFVYGLIAEIERSAEVEDIMAIAGARTLVSSPGRNG